MQVIQHYMWYQMRKDQCPSWHANMSEALLRHRGIFGARLSRLVSGDLNTAFVSNYMVDLPWMLSAMPCLLGAAQRNGESADM